MSRFSLFVPALLCSCVVVATAIAGRPHRPRQRPPLAGFGVVSRAVAGVALGRGPALMEQAHMNVVRVGEFAWSTEEPSEGHYDFDWLERAIALAAKHHIAVVLGTPTDAPPAWLTSKYPGHAGHRCRWPSTSSTATGGSSRTPARATASFCRLIVAQLAKRFGHNPNVIGWQIDNEYTDESFDPATRAQFQQFLHAKYKTLDNLNRHWTTAYWSQTYTAWDQIPMESTHGNPGLLLDHKHFVTADLAQLSAEPDRCAAAAHSADAVHHDEHRRTWMVG